MRLSDWLRDASDRELLSVIAGERPAGMPPARASNARLIAAAPDMLAALELAGKALLTRR